MSGRENFLSRWSRLKQADDPPPEQPKDAAPADTTTERPSMPPLAMDEAQAPSAAGETEPAGDADTDVTKADVTKADVTDNADADIADDAPRERHPTEDIDIDSLTRDSDFTVFLRKGVPEFVQQRAMRKLWTLDPVFAQMDGLNDYENIIEEFGISDLATTDWKVGRGFQTDEDFARINERGGYVPPEEREAEDADEADEAVELADEDANEDIAGDAADEGASGDGEPDVTEEDAGTVAEDADATATEDETLAVGDGDSDETT